MVGKFKLQLKCIAMNHPNCALRNGRSVELVVLRPSSRYFKNAFVEAVRTLRCGAVLLSMAGHHHEI